MNKELVILGAGESGVGAALLGQALGQPVFVSDAGTLSPGAKDSLDQAGIAYEEGGHTEARILAAGEVVKSPGIPRTAPLVAQLLAQGTPVIGEIEFAARHTQKPIVAITGTNGKTTTTAWVHHMLKASGVNAALVGNIGHSFARALAQGDTADCYVLEVSSFMLDDTVNFKPTVALLLNISADHLDRYNDDLKEYANSKMRILQNMDADGTLIYNADDALVAELLAPHDFKGQRLVVSVQEPVNEGAYRAHDLLKVNVPGKATFEVEEKQVNLPGVHNHFNAMAAALAAMLMGGHEEGIRKGLRTFQGIAHRMESVSTIDGIRFVNDSKGTNVNSVYHALEAYKEPIVWIAGGLDKGNDYDVLAPLVKQKVKALICLGVDNSKIIDYFKDMVPSIDETTEAADAVVLAYSMCKEGDTVLLSPACASFDLFNNYEHRGDEFKKAVYDLKNRIVKIKISKALGDDDDL